MSQSSASESVSGSVPAPKLKLKLPKMIMFCGLPGSGKSTLSSHLHHTVPGSVLINQDTQGRSVMIETFQNNLKSPALLIIDNTNLTCEKRREWLELAFYPRVWLIYMATPWEECLYRVGQRKNHPTVKGDGRRIVEACRNQLESPLESLEEKKQYERIWTMDKDEDLEEFCIELGIPNIEIPEDNQDSSDNNTVDSNGQSASSSHSKILKFPRTRHLTNLGGASRDDLLLSGTESMTIFQQLQQLQSWILYLEEKIDGANLGIFIDYEMKIRIQNRSHYVNSQSHPQFALLDKWIYTHSQVLFELLVVEDEILYGEWCYYKHSIHYTQLPDYFMCFDLYNRKTKTFVSRAELERRLAVANAVVEDDKHRIHQVPVLFQGKVQGVDDILPLLNRPSTYTKDSKLEGVYLRFCDEQRGSTVERCKLVRKDFICGDSHWTKGKYVRNRLIGEYWNPDEEKEKEKESKKDEKSSASGSASGSDSKSSSTGKNGNSKQDKDEKSEDKSNAKGGKNGKKRGSK